MNRLWTVGALILIIAALATTETYYTLNTAKTVENHIDNAMIAYQADEKEETAEWIEKAKNSWAKNNKQLHIFLYHDTVHSIQITILTAEQMLKKDTDDFTAECIKAKEQLHFLQETQLPSLENIL